MPRACRPGSPILNSPDDRPASARASGAATAPGGVPSIGVVLFALASAAFASMASIRIADPMLPRLAQDFASTPAQAASVITAFALAYGAMQLVFGPAGDRYGKLRVIATAALAAAAGSVLCAVAPTLPLLTAARFVTGACCAAIIPLSIAWIGDTVEVDRRQETLALFANGTLLGVIAGQALGGIAVDTVGWRVAFVALAALFAGFGWRLLVTARRMAPEPRAADRAAGGGTGMLRAYAAVLGSGWARFVLMVAFFEGALMFGALAFVPTWLHLRFGYALSAAGLLVAAVGVGGLLFAWSARHWIARLGQPGLPAVGGSAIAVGLAVLVAPHWLDPRPTLLASTVVAACLMAGFGFYMLHNTLQAQATQLAPHARGTAVGLFAVALFVGQSIGVAGAAALVQVVGYPFAIGGAGLLTGALGLIVGAALKRRMRHGG
jgi:MFS transporter, YNFM family, putative membrane transport protein